MVVFGKIQEHGLLGAVFHQGAVAFVGFYDQDAGVAFEGIPEQPFLVQANEVCARNHGRIFAAGPEDFKDHRGDGGFAAGAAHGKGAVGGDDGGEQIGAVPNGDAAFPGRGDIGVIVFDGR